MSISQHGGPVRFFLGTNSAQGFVSFFSQLAGPEPDWHTYIIKGGPGCGKSTFLRRVAAQYAPQDPDAQLICCSSDRDSLDAVILPRFHVSLADGTAPHVLEADFPALRQTLLPLGDGLDPEALAPSGPAILALFGGRPPSGSRPRRPAQAACRRPPLCPHPSGGRRPAWTPRPGAGAAAILHQLRRADIPGRHGAAALLPGVVL